MMVKKKFNNPVMISYICRNAAADPYDIHKEQGISFCTALPVLGETLTLHWQEIAAVFVRVSWASSTTLSDNTTPERSTAGLPALLSL